MTTLLAVGDMHLGRRPAALHPDLISMAAELGPEAAWQRTVSEAIQRGVDAVLLAGDVVERSRDLLVAYGDLKRGIERLAAADIPVLAVAGNHDTLVLPRLAGEIDGLRLLGAEGRWQQARIGDLSVIGWSFPRPQVHHNPLQDFPPIAQPERVIGLLHCDRDQADSPYAPVSSADLQSAPTAAWLLGHIHQPDSLRGPRPIGYLGSLNALRASETGARGPWLLHWSQSGIDCEQLALAPLRYEALAVDVSQLEGPERLPEAILATARPLALDLARQAFSPAVIGLRLSLVGRCRFAPELSKAGERLLEESRPWEEQGLRLFIQKIEIRTQPDFDLARLAGQPDPCGLLARQLLILADPAHPEHSIHLEQGRSRLLQVAGLREFQALDLHLDDAALCDWLQRAGQRALLALLAQRQAAP